MSEEFYLQPFNYSFDKKGDIKFQNVNILKTKRKNSFEIKHTVNISKTITNSKPNTHLKKYFNLSARLERINNPFTMILLISKTYYYGGINITKR